MLNIIGAFGTFLSLVLVAAELAAVPMQGTGIPLTARDIRPDVFECPQAAAALKGCYTYFRGIGSKPSLSCCNEVKSIIDMGSKQEEQPLGCKCFREAISYFDNLKENGMFELTKDCYVDLAPTTCT